RSTGPRRGLLSIATQPPRRAGPRRGLLPLSNPTRRRPPGPRRGLLSIATQPGTTRRTPQGFPIDSNPTKKRLRDVKTPAGHSTKTCSVPDQSPCQNLWRFRVATTYNVAELETL